jgi:hypothetical protein
MMMRTTKILGAALGTVLLLAPLAVSAVESPMELQWAQLIPAAPPKAPKTFFARPADPASEPTVPADLPEARWLSSPVRSSGAPPPVVAALDGKLVRIGGYVVPLDFEATNVKEFLLVPYVGACIHVPPPPANQIIYVKTAKGFDVNGTFDPVYVTGTLKADSTFLALAETGYSLDADKVELRK